MRMMNPKKETTMFEKLMDESVERSLRRLLAQELSDGETSLLFKSLLSDPKFAAFLRVVERLVDENAMLERSLNTIIDTRDLHNSAIKKLSTTMKSLSDYIVAEQAPAASLPNASKKSDLN